MIFFLILFIFLLSFFFIGRNSWKLFGFVYCQSAGIEHVEVTNHQVKINGFYPGSFPEGFIGYHAEEQNGKLYIGFKFSTLFGFYETGNFTITIPTKENIEEIYIKTNKHEYLIWNKEE